MDPSKPPVRGRARGRSGGTVPPQQPGPQAGDRAGSECSPSDPGQGVAYEQMYGNAGNGGNGAGSNGEGNGNGSTNGGNGSGNGNGNGNGSNGGDRPSESGVVPRGGGPGITAEQILRRFDYVVSRPEPGFNKQGSISGNEKTVPIIANYFAFKKHPQFKYLLYKVKTVPDVDNDSLLRRLVRVNKDHLGTYLLTGRQMFKTLTLEAEAGQSLTFENVGVTEDAEQKYTLIFEFDREVDNSEPLVFQFYNVVARRMQSLLNLQQLGRLFYDPKQKVEFRNWQLELWPGFQNSIRQQEREMLMNVECVWKVLRKETVFQKLDNIRRSQDPNWRDICRREVGGMQVITVYNKKAHKVVDVDFSKKPTDSFPKKDGSTITYVEYYKEVYNIDIQNLQQPLLEVKPTERDKRRTPQGQQPKPVYLIPELCWPCGLNEEMRGNFRLMKDLASCLHMKPMERVTTMKNFIARINNDTTELDSSGEKEGKEETEKIKPKSVKDEMRKWGCLVKPDPVEFQARRYDPEDIVFAGSRKFKANDQADWTMAFRSEKMLTAQHLSKWVVVVTSRDAQNVNNLVGTMQRVATPIGYRIDRPAEVSGIPNPRSDSYTRAIADAYNRYRGNLDMFLIVLANNNADTYAQVKKKCSIEYGIPSQCFLAKHFNNAKGLMSICTKLVIQMNAKQGGEPWGVVIPLKDMMVLGYDVHHSGPGGGSSVGAMTATINATYGRYFSCVERLVERAEIYTKIAKMFEKCLRAYQQQNQDLPKRVVMYRDGVGEGQLDYVYEEELKSFDETIKTLYKDKGFKPKLTYIVVNKRINTRFFAKFGENYDNPKPGLVVDDVVTRPERYDFYLVSQVARQGCVSPTYYNVLRDESGLPPDKMQRLTYKFCHLYYNWSGTVAVPGPCQNAHKLALLTGTALKNHANRNLDYLLHFL